MTIGVLHTFHPVAMHSNINTNHLTCSHIVSAPCKTVVIDYGRKIGGAYARPLTVPKSTTLGQIQQIHRPEGVKETQGNDSPINGLMPSAPQISYSFLIGIPESMTADNCGRDLVKASCSYQSYYCTFASRCEKGGCSEEDFYCRT